MLGNRNCTQRGRDCFNSLGNPLGLPQIRRLRSVVGDLNGVLFSGHFCLKEKCWMLSFKPLSITAVCILVVASSASAQQQIYTAVLNQLNGSNATGNAILTWDQGAQTLRVELALDNAEPDMVHAMHIHGRFDGSQNAIDSTTPTLAQDTDGDGFIEVLEGVATYGDIILPLSMPPASNNDPNTQAFPTAPLGNILFDQTYDLTNEGQFFSPVTGADYSSADILPLALREIVVHGKTVADGIGSGTAGEVDGTGGYKANLPIAAGEIVGVPEPATCSVAVLAMLSVLTLRRRH